MTYVDDVQTYRALNNQLLELPHGHPQLEAGNQMLGEMTWHWPEAMQDFIYHEDSIRLQLFSRRQLFGPDVVEDPHPAELVELEATLRAAEAQVDGLAKTYTDAKNGLQVQMTELLAALRNAAA
jgi:hypothetical protein